MCGVGRQSIQISFTAFQIAVPTLPALAVNSDLLYTVRVSCGCFQSACAHGSPGTPFAGQTMSPVPYYPAIPPRVPYTSCYCEENIYLLAASFLEIPDFRNSWDLSVVFISNRTKTASDLSLPSAPGGCGGVLFIRSLMVETLNDVTQVALWGQRAARAEGIPIVWDYHVVLVLRPVPGEGDVDDGQTIGTGSLIYDLDTTLQLPDDTKRE